MNRISRLVDIKNQDEICARSDLLYCHYNHIYIHLQSSNQMHR